MNKNTDVITLGAGCFWCIESAFNSLQGIVSAVSGYMGGRTDNPTYEDVKTGYTGHAEVVQVTYEPEVISTREVLEIIFALHDPTQIDRQGNDVGTQYRSAIFYHSDEQREIAQDVMEIIKKEEIWPDPLATELTPASTFFPAEDYHQNYVAENPENPYCQMVVSPKLKKFKETFRAKLK